MGKGGGKESLPLLLRGELGTFLPVLSPKVPCCSEPERKGIWGEEKGEEIETTRWRQRQRALPGVLPRDQEGPEGKQSELWEDRGEGKGKDRELETNRFLSLSCPCVGVLFPFLTWDVNPIPNLMSEMV